MGDEKRISFENPKRKNRGYHLAKPTHRLQGKNRCGRKNMPWIWLDQIGVVYYDLLKPRQNDRYRPQMINLNLALMETRPLYA